MSNPHCPSITSHSDQGAEMTNYPDDQQIEDAYALAKERYAGMGVDTDRAMETLSGVSRLAYTAGRGTMSVGLNQMAEN
jgi:hypothetical protein